MANLDFYAAQEDLINLLNFIYTETDCRIFESYSESGQSLQEFKSIEEFFAVYDNKISSYKQGYIMILQLWSPSVSSHVKVRRIDLDPRKCDGHKFRFTIEGWGLMQLYFGAQKEGQIRSSHFGHNSLKRAQNWEPTCKEELGLVSDWNWDLLMQISRQIQYQIRKKLAAAKSGSRPILQKANELLLDGFNLTK